MKSKKIDLKKVAEELQRECPFIAFAYVGGIGENEQLIPLENLDLAVFVEKNTGISSALQKILPAMTNLVPDAFCEVILLNRADPVTRFRASKNRVLFVRDGQDQARQQFNQRASLDYRILRAQNRRRGLIVD